MSHTIWYIFICITVLPMKDLIFTIWKDIIINTISRITSMVCLLFLNFWFALFLFYDSITWIFSRFWNQFSILGLLIWYSYQIETIKVSFTMAITVFYQLSLCVFFLQLAFNNVPCNFHLDTDNLFLSCEQSVLNFFLFLLGVTF